METYSVPSNLAHVVWEEAGDGSPTVYLAPLVDGPALVLQGTAALIWLSAVSAEPAGRSVLTQVAAWFDQDPSVVKADVDAFLADLCHRGLLVRETGAVGDDTHPSGT